MSRQRGFTWQGEDLLLTLRVQPRASRDEICGLLGESIKVRITAPPVDGQANDHLIRFLARQFGVARSQVTLISGISGRDKRIMIRSPKRLPSEVSV
ncbi:MAG: YggU family protein [Gammaproteobacteria bacterium]|nr:YggU family protein [Gammaproteobacteria bacterium]